VRDFLAFPRVLRSCWLGRKLCLVVGNFSPHKHRKVTGRAAGNGVDSVFLSACAFWLNWIESEFAALRYFALNGTDHHTHAWQGKMIDRYMRGVTLTPSQYRRRWDGDDGESSLPTNPGLADVPPLQPYWGPDSSGQRRGFTAL
jgi:hypothetical protein